MKEKIYNYLVENDSKVSTHEIIKKFFRIFDHYPPQMETIVESILKDDPRFIRDDTGDWQVQKKQGKDRLADVIFAIVEIEAIPIDSNREIPVLLGIARVKNAKLISQQFFSLEISAEYSHQLTNRINQLQENLTADQAFNRNVELIYQNLDKTIIISYTPTKVMAIMNYFFRNYTGLETESETISLVSLARKLIPGIKIRSIEDIANSLSITFHSPLDLKNRLNLMAEILFIFLQEFNQINIQTLTELREFIAQTKSWVDFSNYNFNKDYIKNLPTTPGVYLMKDRQGQVFYIGKAKNLRSRIESYFVNRFEMEEKGKEILSKINNLTFEAVGSELEALLLENNYINKFRPVLNKQIKIHPLDISKFKTKKMILFLRGTIENQVVLYVVNGIITTEKISINLDMAVDWEYLKKIIDRIFFGSKPLASDFSPEQMEIIWRWFSVNKDLVNFIDIDQCGSPDNCLETVKKYCSDEQLLAEKIFHR